MLARQNRHLLLGALVLMMIVFLQNGSAGSVQTARAAPGADVYELSWWTVDGGGAGNAAGGSYALSGTAGQYDDGPASRGSYALEGGFWVDWLGFKLHLPHIQRTP
jgi:hypothetical protein